jgi:hypothetical protein
MESLRRLSNSGSVEGIRKFIKTHKIDASPRDLNKIVRIEGYKFISRFDNLLYIKDTQYHRHAMESGLMEDSLPSFGGMQVETRHMPKVRPTSGYKFAYSAVGNSVLAQDNAKLRKERAELTDTISHLLHRLKASPYESFGRPLARHIEDAEYEDEDKEDENEDEEYENELPEGFRAVGPDDDEEEDYQSIQGMFPNVYPSARDEPTLSADPKGKELVKREPIKPRPNPVLHFTRGDLSDHENRLKLLGLKK